VVHYHDVFEFYEDGKIRHLDVLLWQAGALNYR